MSHAPIGYECPFCQISRGLFDSKILTNEADVVLKNELITAFVASHQWQNNAGHILIISNPHFENLYALPVAFAAPIHKASKRIAGALKLAFDCSGISTRQHNEPDGGQDVWHYHQHIFPRYKGDNLYGSTRRLVSPAERAVHAQRIRQALLLFK